MEQSIGDLANTEKLATEAMARVAPDAAALSLEELTQVNLDLQQATGTILGVLPEVIALRERIVKELPAFDITQVDKLEDYALALRFAHAAYQTATLPPDDLSELSGEALALRERLVADATALSLHGLLDGRKLESLKGAKGIKNVAQDLQMLSQIMQESWPKIQGKSATVATDLEAASRIGTRLTRIVGVREQGPAQVAAATEQRQRVFTLTIRAYQEARAAVSYVRRRAGDAESITPNLYTGKGRGRPTDGSDTDTDTDTDTNDSVTDGAQTSGSGTEARVPGGRSSAPVGNTTGQFPAITPAAVAAAVAAQKGGSGSKDPFLS